MTTSSAAAEWGRDFDPDRLAALELRMWKAYYRRQPARLMALLIQANREQAGRLVAAGRRRRVRPRACGRRLRAEHRRLRPVPAGHRARLPDARPAGPVDAEAVARRELRWWVVRREIGLAAGEAAGRRRSPTSTPSCTTSRGRRSPRPAACAGSRPRCATAARRAIRTARPVVARPTGRRSPACSATRTAACRRRSDPAGAATLGARPVATTRAVGQRLRVRHDVAAPGDPRRDRRDPRRRRRPRPLVAVGLPRRSTVLEPGDERGLGRSSTCTRRAGCRTRCAGSSG